MGKSNKFDYTNRTNAGAKLGQIVGRDLEREAERVKNQAERKSRKASIGSFASTASSLDTLDSVTHILDVKLPGKQLGDDGVCAMLDGLEIAIRQGSREASVVLEDLNLTDNRITTKSLARLAPVIRLARLTLKTLDLSKNNIQVHTAEEVQEWEAFLRAFENCFRMRRLDLSGNLDLGPRALETLARVYVREKDCPTAPPSGMASVTSLAEEVDYADQETHRESSFTNSKLHNAVLLPGRTGLKSIPYITLKNVGLTDAGATWLSYVVEDHGYPSQLIDELNATGPNSSINAYQQTASEAGLEWSSEEGKLSRDGKSLLEKAERLRRQTMLDEELSMDSLATVSKDDDEEHVYPRATQGDPRASVRAVHANNSRKLDQIELDSARRKTQRSVLQQHGLASVDLWRTALRLTVVVQVLSGIGPAVRHFYTGPSAFSYGGMETDERSMPTSQPGTPKGNADRFENAVPTTPAPPPRQGTYASTLVANSSVVAGEPELAITEVTNSPTTPKMIFRPHRKCAFSDGGDAILTQKLEELPFANALKINRDPQRFVRYQKDRIEKMGGAPVFRNPEVASHLTKGLAEMIASYALPQHELKLLTASQRAMAVSWGLDRANLAALKEMRKYADSVQMWSILESIGCLQYRRE